MDQPVEPKLETTPQTAQTMQQIKPKKKPKIELHEKKGTWDKGINYFEANAFFMKEYTELKKMPKKLWVLLALVQLRNGCRAGEAVYAVVKWVETGERKLTIPVEKRKEAFREIIIPKYVDEDMRKKVAEYLTKRGITSANKEKLLKFMINYKTCLLMEYGVNSHSLRYAFVTFLLEKGVESALVAKIIGHRSTQNLLRYVQEKKANEILEKLEV